MAIKQFVLAKDVYISKFFETDSEYHWYCEPVFIGSAKNIKILMTINGIGPNESIVSKYLVSHYYTTAGLTIQGALSKDNPYWETLTESDDPSVATNNCILEYSRDTGILPWIRVSIDLYRNGYARRPFGFGEITCSVVLIAEY